jgi:hypothetical protein
LIFRPEFGGEPKLNTIDAVNRNGKTDAIKRGCDIMEEIIPLSVRGLEVMYDYKEKRFNYCAQKFEGGILNSGLSRRYTLVTLLGLVEYEKHGGKSFLNIQEIVSDLHSTSNQTSNIGDLGLLIWLCAMASPSKLEKLFMETRANDALTQYGDARRGCTMELSWFLTGLSMAYLMGNRDIAWIKKKADATVQQILGNYGGKGIFGHLRKSSATGLIRGQIGSFADQVYPIYALTLYHKAFISVQALDVAKKCADTICQLQGTLGQWWWHYNSATGKVVGSYPVYSVHQEGMAPMALYFVGETTGKDYSAQIIKGLEWIRGNNELGVNMIDLERNVIWRCLYRPKWKSYPEELLRFLRYRMEKMERKDLRILYECRSYCFGWLLYALAGKVSKRNVMGFA